MSTTRQKNSLLLCTTVAVFVLAMPLVAWGAEPSFVALEPIPGISGASAGSDIGAFVSNVFRALISLGALLAVFMLTLGAVQYMTSETLGLKEAGKERMQSAIWGLLLLISSVLILYVINPELLNFNLIVKSTQPLSVGPAANQFAPSLPPGNAAPSGPGTPPGAPGSGAPDKKASLTDAEINQLNTFYSMGISLPPDSAAIKAAAEVAAIPGATFIDVLNGGWATYFGKIGDIVEGNAGDLYSSSVEYAPRIGGSGSQITADMKAFCISRGLHLTRHDTNTITFTCAKASQ